MSSKQEIIQELESTHPNLQHEVAEKHQGVLLDIKCLTPNCGKVYKRVYFNKPAHRDGKQEDEFRHLSCLNCGSKGNYSWKYSNTPSLSDIGEAREIERQNRQKLLKSKIEEIDNNIESLQQQRHYIVEQLNAVTPTPTGRGSESGQA